MSATLSWSTGTFPEDELEPALRWADRIGVEAVEVSPRHAPAIRERFQRGEGWQNPARVRLASLHAWTQAEGLAEVCPTAQRLGVAVIVVHCPHERLTADFEGQAAQVREWTAWCRDHGLVLSVENSSRQPLEPFVHLFEAVPDLSLTLDVKHAYKPETLGLTYVDYLKPLGERVVNFHVSGVDRSRDELGDGTPPGRDHIDWAGLCAELLRRRYDGLITVELSINRDLPPDQLAAAYADLPAPPGVERPSLSQRLSFYGIQFFRKQFAPLLAP